MIIAPRAKKPSSGTDTRVTQNKFRYSNNRKVSAINYLTLSTPPGPGESLTVVTTGKHINAFAFVQYILEKEVIKALHIASYCMTKKVTLWCCDLLEREKIDTLQLYVSCNPYAIKPDVKRILTEMTTAAPDLCTVKYFHNHAKLALIETEENYYILTGSGNFSDNAITEIYELKNDKELFEFHIGWLSDIQNEYI